MIYIAGTVVDIRNVDQTRSRVALTIGLKPGVRYDLGRILKKPDDESVFYQFYYGESSFVECKFPSTVEADKTIARLRGEVYVEDDPDARKQINLDEKMKLVNSSSKPARYPRRG